jgi:hypothetical protein
MTSTNIKEYKDFDDLRTDVELSQERIIIYKEVPSRIEIIERLFSGDDREQRVIEWGKNIMLDIRVPHDKQHQVIDINESLGRNVVLNSIQYYEQNNELILHNIVTFDLDQIC